MKINHIKILTKLELCNIFGINVLRHTKDKNSKKKSYIVAAIVMFLLAYLMIYIGVLSYGLSYIGLKHYIPTFAIAISSIFIFLVEIFKASNTIFKSSGYDILCSFPIGHSSIVISRILRLYIEGIVICLMVFVPSFGVYIYCAKPDILFYLLGIPAILFIPMFAIALSILVGVVITGLTCRMKHKSIFSSMLLISVLGIIMLASSSLASFEGNMSKEAMRELTINLIESIEKYLPHVALMGTSIVGCDIAGWIISIGINATFITIVSFIVVTAFQPIYSNLTSTSAKHNYTMQSLKQTSLLKSLCIKEFRRYFSSSAYVTNTIIGPIMGIILAASLIFVDINKITSDMPMNMNITDMLPFLLGAIFCLMPPICVSISMEGKYWWISKTLPINAKTLFDSKILMNLLLYLPFYVISEVILAIAMMPDIISLLWQLAIPVIILVFSSVYCLFINLRFPIFKWENETVAVKQSMASFLGGIGGTLIVMIAGLIIGICPNAYVSYVKLVICIALISVSIVLYMKNNRTNLKDID